MSESESGQLVNAMRALQIALDRHDAAVSAAHSLGQSDWRCLQKLVEDGPQSPGSLQQSLGLTSGSVTALLDRLERRGLVRRCPHEVDRRALRIEVCDAGGALVANATSALSDITAKLLTRWGTSRADAAGQACADLAKLVEWAAQRA